MIFRGGNMDIDIKFKTIEAKVFDDLEKATLYCDQRGLLNDDERLALKKYLLTLYISLIELENSLKGITGFMVSKIRDNEKVKPTVPDAPVTKVDDDIIEKL